MVSWAHLSGGQPSVLSSCLWKLAAITKNQSLNFVEINNLCIGCLLCRVCVHMVSLLTDQLSDCRVSLWGPQTLGLSSVSCLNTAPPPCSQHPLPSEPFASRTPTLPSGKNTPCPGKRPHFTGASQSGEFCEMWPESLKHENNLLCSLVWANQIPDSQNEVWKYD